MATGEIIAEEDTSPIRSVSFSPDGVTLAAASWDGTVKLWDVAAGNIAVVISGHMDAGRSVSFSPDGSTLATGVVTFTVLLWDVATREIIATLEDNPGTVNSVSFSLDGATPGCRDMAQYSALGCGDQRNCRHP